MNGVQHLDPRWQRPFCHAATPAGSPGAFSSRSATETYPYAWIFVLALLSRASTHQSHAALVNAFAQNRIL